MTDMITAERLHRAEKALADDLPSTNPLWKPWAMDLADDVKALVAERDAWKVEAVHHSGEVIRLRNALEEIAIGRWNHGRAPIISVNDFAHAILNPEETA